VRAMDSVGDAHPYPVRTDPKAMWEEGHMMPGFDTEERLVQKLPHDFAAKVVWGSRYPHHDTTLAGTPLTDSPRPTWRNPLSRG
jgi:hypothetical protein